MTGRQFSCRGTMRITPVRRLGADPPHDSGTAVELTDRDVRREDVWQAAVVCPAPAGVVQSRVVNEHASDAPSSSVGVRRTPDHPTVAGVSRATRDRACRRLADKTPHHGPTPLSTLQHRDRPEPWTVQHLCARGSTPHHAFGRFPKPGVAGSIPAGGAIFACTGRFQELHPGPNSSETAVGADISPTSTHPNYNTERSSDRSPPRLCEPM